MKKMIFLRVLLSAWLVLAGAAGLRAQSPDLYTDPVVYNDFIVGEQTKIGGEIMNFTNSFNEEDVNEVHVRNAYDNLLNTIASCVSTLENLKGYDGSTRLRNASLELFHFYDRIVRNQYKELLEMMLKPELTPDDRVRYAEIVDSITKEEAGVDEEFAAAQEEFAAKYNIELTNEEEDE